MVTVRNEFDSLQETSERHSPNDEYENFVTTKNNRGQTKSNENH